MSLLEKIRTAEYYLRKCYVDAFYSIRYLAGHRGQAPDFIQDVAKNELDLRCIFIELTFLCDVVGDTVRPLKDPYQIAAKYFQYIMKLKTEGRPYEMKRLFGHRHQAPLSVMEVIISTEDLKSLLLKYPQTFCIEDDTVALWETLKLEKGIDDPCDKILNVLSQSRFSSTCSSSSVTSSYSDSIVSCSTEPTVSDYVEEAYETAAEFFESIIQLKSGKMPYEISRLVGHRSQAPPEVYDIIANEADLKSLFLKFPDKFVVYKKTVSLCSSIVQGDISSSPAKEHLLFATNVHSSLGGHINDTDRKAADFFASVIKKKAGGKPYEINRLIGHRAQARPGVCDSIVNVADLKALLLKHPKRFIVQDNTVLLVCNSPSVHSTLGDHANKTFSKAADYFASIIMKNSGGKPYEINRLIAQAPPGVCDNVLNVADLKKLFLIYPKRFIVQDNTVSLISNSSVALTLRENVNDTDSRAADYFASIINKKAGEKPYEINRLIGHRAQARPGVCDNIVNVSDLKELFLKHPKRFIVKGNTVSLSNSSVNNSSGKINVKVEKDAHCLSGEQIRESYKKAADFFASILESKSKGKPYPIKNLVGHRSQAPPGVCDNVISPENIRSLCLMFPERFVVTHKSVSLVTNFLSPAPALRTSSDLLKLNDSYKDAANFFASIIMTKSEGMSYEIHRLLGHRSQAPPGVRDAILNVPDLTSLFLRFPDTFVIEENTVSLISSETEDTLNSVKDARREAEEYFSNILRNRSPFKILLIDELYREVRNAPDDIKRACGGSRVEFVKFLKQFPKSFIVTGENVFNHTAISHRKISDYNPIKHANILNSLYSVFEALTNNGKPNSIKTLFSDYVSLSSEWTIKSVDELIEFLKIFPNTFYVLNETVVNLLCISAKKTTKCKSESKSLPPKISFVTLESSNWKGIVLQQTEVVRHTARCKEIVLDILSKEKVIGLDCEGFRLGWGGKISLLQISIQSGKCFIFDILSDGSMMSDGELSVILESPKILKVLHDCRNDSRNLFSEFEIQLENVFDTQIAYKHLTKNKLSIGFNDICLKYGVSLNTEKDAMRNVYKIQPDIWLIRPLSEDMIAYAAQDVACLFPPLFAEMLRGVSQTNFQRILTLSDIASKTHW